ncbi:hypothetical protein QBC35DRAFT_512107 [Podospora australis]|uniref:Uncharacterized protein n=1 Tax=Podospora australis TaxID=1536484 RepID=A0AAN6X4M2_9PEZI|nr:hypothetical protein QBC35DRAFT_512107 [Podospora australis]
MADDPHNTSDISDHIETDTVKEDAETTAARRELKQTSISEKAGQPSPSQDDKSASEDDAPKDKATAQRITPPVGLSAPDAEALKEQISSPKKKRAHDELDENKDVTEAPLDAVVADTTTTTLDRTDRSEPEKKRPRDPSASPRSSMEQTTEAQPSIATTSFTIKTDSKPAATSSSAFASSGFAKLAAPSSSPFGSFGGAGAGKPSLFGSANSSGSSFGSVLGGSTPAGTAAPAPKLSFGGAAASSPFSGLNGQTGGSVFKSSSPFGSAFGGSALSGGARLSNFGGGKPPGGALKSDKPARPFGAPESDAEDGSEKEDDDADEEKGEVDGSEEEEKQGDREDSKAADDKKKPKLHKVVVDDGEKSEVTLFSQRAKMYVMEKGVGWKERGAGMLKVNVPRSTVEFDDNNHPDPSSFDASVLEDIEEGEPKHVRLIMRQDHTLRVILNTVVLPAMQFKVTHKLKSATVLFTAFEGGEAKQVQMKRAAASATESPSLEPTPDLEENGTNTPQPQLSRASTPSSQPPQKKPRKTKKQKEEEEAAAEEPVDLPPYFQSLSRTHGALNLVYTFCAARTQQLATTLDTLKGAVEQQTRSPLVIEDVAAIKALRPEGVRLECVDGSVLKGEYAAEKQKDDFFRTAGGRGGASLPMLDLDELGNSSRQHQEEVEEDEEVLLFEFIDGDLKRATGSKGDARGGGGRSGEDRLKMPVFSHKQMMGLIEKRNTKFKKALDTFVRKCVQEKMDPELVLQAESERFIPHRKEKTPEQLSQIQKSTLPETIPKDRKSIAEIVEELRSSEWYTGQIVPDGHRVFEAQEAVYGDLDFLLSQDMVNALYNTKGITRFYAHQAEAINSLHAGHNVVVATSTSSGKSLIYQLPVLHALEEDRNTRAMYIFPTKALAQDQKRSLKEMMGFMPGMEDVLVETFDGDTPFHDRNTIRDEARIVFTNPDMLHITILPQEERWRSFLQNLRYVVVDELHYYNGLMGSHVAFIMRRLRRICAAVGNRRVRFISCSATVANPEEHFRTIFGIEDVRLVDFDGSPSGRKEFLCWNTPFRDPGDPSSGRGNAAMECSRLFCQLILRGVRVIAFCRVRAQCEKLVSAIKQELETLGRPEVINRVMGYRGGYTAQDRRRIEGEMFEGKLLGIVATTALELGVDIGTLDCVLTWGFPYTIANLRQQSGRAGRRNKDSLSILVGDCFATDQHYMQNPDELFTKPNCALQVDLDNMLVKEGHIQCAAYELPIRPAQDSVYFGKDLAQICKERLLKDDTGFYHCHDRFRPLPSKFVSIRDTEEDQYAIIDITHGRNIVLEELEASRATFTIYDGAIFLHQGETYLVRDFNPDRKMARVEKVKVDWTTSQRDYTDIDPIETEAVKRINGSRSRAYYGAIRIKQVVFGYFKVDKRTNRILDAVQVDNPPVIRHSKGMWLDIPKRALDILVERQLHVAGSIHAAQHAVMSLIPNFVISLPGDVRTECKNPLKEFAKKETSRKRPARLTFYDAKGGDGGGSGINTRAFEFVDLLLRQALQRVTSCGCGTVRGCPECCASEMCKESNEVMSKAGCEVVLKSLLDEEIDVDALPMGPEVGGAVAGVETVVLAEPVRTAVTEMIISANYCRMPIFIGKIRRGIIYFNKIEEIPTAV